MNQFISMLKYPFTLSIVAGFLFPRLLDNQICTLVCGLVCSAVLFTSRPFSRLCRRGAVPGVGIVVLVLILFPSVNRHQTLCVPLPFSLVCSVRGHLTQDSSVSRNSNMVMQLSLSGVSGMDGVSASASGTLLCYGGELAVLEAGTVVELSGGFMEGEAAGDYLFKTSGWKVVEVRSTYGLFRTYFVDLITHRLLGNSFSLGESAEEASSVSAMLLLGRTDSTDVAIKELAMTCGCLHVLALSGLHLSFFTGMAEKLLFFSRKKRLKQGLGLGLCLVFIVLIGPKSSLLRAVILLFVSFLSGVFDLGLSKPCKLVLTAIVQLSVFPDSMQGSGAAYSYLAIAGIFLIDRGLFRTLEHYMPKAAAEMLGTGIGALSFSCILGISQNGQWYPVAILLTSVSSTLVFVMMALGLAMVFFPFTALLHRANNLVYGVLRWLFEWGTRVSARFWVAGMPFALAILAAVLLTLWVWIKYSFRRLKKARFADDLELQLRFSNRHKGSSGG